MLEVLHDKKRLFLTTKPPDNPQFRHKILVPLLDIVISVVSCQVSFQRSYDHGCDITPLLVVAVGGWMLILCGFVAAVILGPGDRWCASRGTDNILFTNSTTISKFNVNPCDTREIGESTCTVFFFCMKKTLLRQKKP